MKPDHTKPGLAHGPNDDSLAGAKTNAVSAAKQGGLAMARRRWQQGSIVERNGMFDFRIREDVVLPSGEITRSLKRYVLGPKSELKTKRLAMRHPTVTKKLNELNSVSYKPKPASTFGELAERWQRDFLIQKRPSTQAAIKSQLRKWLLPAKVGSVNLENVPLSAIDLFMAQTLVSYWSKAGIAPKSVHNLVGILGMMWNRAQAWDYVDNTRFPFRKDNPKTGVVGLVMPEVEKAGQPHFSPEQMREVLNETKEPYRTIWWTVGETGMRRGEVCALRAGDINTEQRIIVLKHSNWHGKITPTKSKRSRQFSISTPLAAQLAKFTKGLPADASVFTNRSGKPLNPDNLVKRHLKPVLKKLGLEGAAHAFRHGNITSMSRSGVPNKTIQDRVGHVNWETTQGYIHAVSEDDRNAAEQLGQILNPN